MKEIIVKREDDSDLSLEIIENEFLRVSIRECGEGIQFMDFTLSEIDDLQEAISIMKDKLERKMPPKKEVFELELPTTMYVDDFEKLTGCKCKLYNEKLTVIIKPTDEKLVYGGQISDFPIEVVEKMLERQVEQGKKRDVSVFEKNKEQISLKDGFDWDDSEEDDEFWTEVISHKNFSLFFERYPKKD